MIRNRDGQLPTPPIWVDFTARDNRSRVPLDYPGTAADLSHYDLELHDGMSITLYTHDATETADPDDLVTRGTVERDDEAQRWFVTFDWRSLVHVSDLDELDRTLYESAKRH